MALADILKISFEFSPKLGIRELPDLDRDNGSNIDGLYVVGDLADAPIIKAALNQGYEVTKQVLDELGPSSDDPELLDIVVVGAGPAGIGAALACREKGARYVVLEREKPFATIQNFPRHKLIFSEPREMASPDGFWFEDAAKEELVDRWQQALEDKTLPIHQPEELVDATREGDGFTVQTQVGAGGLMDLPRTDPTSPDPAPEARNTYRCRRVILAIGRRGSVRRLDVPGEDLEKVAYALKDPADHTDRDVLVVGGGDSAVEAACSVAEAGGRVTLSYRKAEITRAKAGNKERLQRNIDAGRVTPAFGTTPVEIREDAVVLEEDGQTRELPNDDVLVFIGTKLPKQILDRLGIRMNGHMDLARFTWIASFALITYLFYVIKTGKDFFPFGPDHPLAIVPAFLKADLGFREVSGSFWGTVIYSLLIVGFGIQAMRRYPSPTQKQRYLSLMGFQLVFLFGIPELLAPLIIDRPWKVYAITVPWPLSIWSLIDAPSWAGGSTGAAVGWIVAGAVTSFVLMPLYVYWNGERFCSWMCGCGGLAETLGDRWRHYAPRGRTAISAEWAGRIILLLAIPVTLLILNDAWGFFATDALSNSKNFAQKWYGLMVDFWLASVVGVAFYPYLGNRVWCRFFCPLRAYMEGLSRLFSRVQIEADSKCIGCGECTRYCQMGIDVQSFAQKQEDMHNGNSACIQCGICVEVCPMDVLELTRNRGQDATSG